jgi:hypothetical protein
MLTASTNHVPRAWKYLSLPTGTVPTQSPPSLLPFSPVCNNHTHSKPLVWCRLDGHTSSPRSLVSVSRSMHLVSDARVAPTSCSMPGKALGYARQPSEAPHYHPIAVHLRRRRPLGHWVDAIMGGVMDFPPWSHMRFPLPPNPVERRRVEVHEVGSNDVGDNVGASNGGNQEHLYHPRGTIPRYGKAMAPVRTHTRMAPLDSWWSMC